MHGTNAMVTNTYIRSVSLWGLDALIEQHGGDVRALLAEVGFPEDQFARADTLINFGALCRMVELAAHRLDRPSLGLEWTESLPPEMPNIEGLMLCAAFARNLHEWIEIGISYWDRHSNGLRAELVDAGGDSPLVIRIYIDPLLLFPVRQLTESAVANIVKMARTVTGLFDENPLVVRFQHFKPRDISIHERLFRCPVEFDQPYNEIVFERRLGEVPSNGNLAMLRPLVNFYAKHRFRRLPHYDQRVSTAVAQAIPSVIGTGRCNVEFIASSLGFSTKKLQRLLAAEGSSFSDVLDKTRHMMARRYLLESRAPISKIAGLLDYSAMPPFTLAFRRWTGTTPLVFRKRARQNEREPVPAEKLEGQ